MSIINYDPANRPIATQEMIDFAKNNQQILFNLLCGIQDDESISLSVVVVGFTIPRIGEKIQLEDGTICIVSEIVHKVSAHAGIVNMMANVVSFKQ